MTVTFTGAGSVADRTIFTNKGPIVKSPLPILVGTNLYIASPDEISIPTGSFTSTAIGKTISISGSPGGRNDGTFPVVAVRGPTRLKLRDANFDFSNRQFIEVDLVALTNDLRSKYDAHRSAIGVHGTADPGNAITGPVAVDLASAILLLNQIKPALKSHSLTVGPLDPPVHYFQDPDSDTWLPLAHDLGSAVLLVNELRARYEMHRQERFFHLLDDSVNRVSFNPVFPVVGSGPLVGPFSWTLMDPRYGQVADDPSDVSVLVNSIPVTVEAVFGLLGAVVLDTKPGSTDTVLIDYRYINNPPIQFERLNSFEFLLNQEGNRGFSGVPKHVYRQRSYLVQPSDSGRAFRSPFAPLKVGWKYKGYERKYTACLNDPNTLLLNVPTNKIMYPVLSDQVFETVVRYDPVTLPQNATDPWSYSGDGVLSLSPGGTELIVRDESSSFSSVPGPPFFSHKIDLTFDSDVSAAYRFKVQDLVGTLTYEGCFTGIGFGLTDGQKGTVIGCISTDAVNLSSAIEMANDIKSKYSSHLVLTGTHRPDDSIHGIDVVDAHDEASLFVLLNRTKKLYNDHISAGPNNIHLVADSVNTVTAVNAVNLSSAIVLANALRAAFNAHRTQLGIHYHNDIEFVVELVKQVGILTSSGYMEEQAAWAGFAHDWSIETTYRIHRDPSGNIGIFLSGDMAPRASVKVGDLPEASGLDLRLDPVHQTFFGSVGDASKSVSTWRFARIDVNPLDSVQIGGNKSVSYPTVISPELDPNFPWIVVGQGGTERANGSLMIDSTASVSEEVAAATGLITGEYRGFLRIEPSLSDRTTLSFEFSMSSSFYSFGIDNRSLGVHFGDGTFATQLCFLQGDPVPASLTGTFKEPLPVVTGDVATFTVDGGLQILVTATVPISTAAALAALINAAAGFPVAFPDPGGFPSTIRMTSPTFGSGSSLRIIGGQIFEKLGIPTGSYFGRDTSPEPRISWVGTNVPDLVTVPWISSGNQSATMFERTLRITDTSSTGFRSYTLSDPTVTSKPIPFASDWKADFRIKVLSFIAGDSVMSGPNLRFCGTLMNIDEGPSGKGLEVHTSTDLGGSPYVGVYSYDSLGDTLNFIAGFPFTWTDGEEHSFSVYTSKLANLVLVLADGAVLGSFPYSSLKTGVYGPSISFGSGGNPVSNCDMRSAASVTDWNSVCCVSDRKVSDPLAASRRYIGLYRGGDPSILSSYYLHQIDWTIPHKYRVVRDPTTAVSVFLDGAVTPVISSGYDVLTLPLSVLDFLSGIVPSGRFVAFGSFSSSEIVRSKWDRSIDYSIGKMTTTEGIVPPHHLINQANVVASPEHLETQKVHDHSGTNSWSGGTPFDEFMSDPEVPAHTILGEGTPPVPMTENLESRGGFVTTVTTVESIPSVDLVNAQGSISSFEDDLENTVVLGPVVGVIATEASIISSVAAFVTSYLTHIASGVFHVIPDAVNIGISIPVTFANALSSLNLLQSKYNSHRSQAGVHHFNDPLHQSSAPAAVDIASAIALLSDLTFAYDSHIVSSVPHVSASSPFGLPPFLPDSIALSNELKSRFNFHLSQVGVHFVNDMADVVTSPYATDLATAIILVNEIRFRYESHRVYPFAHVVNDVVNFVSVPLAFDEPSFYALLADLVSKFNSHRVQPGVHVVNDVVNVTLPNSETLFRILEDVRSKINTHILSVPVHSYADQADQVLDPLLFKLDGPGTTGDPTITIAFIARVKAALTSHFGYSGHLTSDYVNTAALAALPIPIDLTTALANANGFRSILGAHVGNQIQAHNPLDSINSFPGSSAADPLPEAVKLANELLEDVVRHILRKPSHLKVIAPSSPPSPAFDTASLISLVNGLKSIYETHRIRTGVHVLSDMVNVTTAPDATDLETSITLANDLRSMFNQHRIQTGVHSSTVIVRLDPPSRVLYESLKFYTFPSGETGHVSTASDDETLHMRGVVGYQTLQRLTYPGSFLPNRATMVGSAQAPFTIVDGDTMSVAVNRGTPVEVVFQGADTTVAAVVARINGTVGVPVTLASDSGDGRVRLTEQIGGPSSWIEVSGAGAMKLGLDTSQPTPWVLVANNLSSVTASIQTSGPTEFLRMGTSGAGTSAAYVVKTGLTDQPSTSFYARFRIRIQSWAYGPDGDTGIYVGVSGASGPGFTAAVGFINESGVRTVILRDLTSGRRIASRSFDWGLGTFNTYVISRSADGKISLEASP